MADQHEATVAEHWVCPDCGPHVSVDEDGCCYRCGADCEGALCGGHVCGTLLEAARAEVERLRVERDAALAEAEFWKGTTPHAEMQGERDAARAEVERLRATLRDARMFVDNRTAARIDTALKGGDGG